MDFKIGDTVWMARFDSTASSVECPDCGGTGRLRVTFHDETQVSIHCVNCARGYEPPTGRVTVHERKATALFLWVAGMEITSEGIEYHLTDHATGYSYRSGDVFATREEAEARGAVMAEAAKQEELARVYRKERDTRSWAWNATYHRKEIQRCQREIDRHTARLAVASSKARKEKAEGGFAAGEQVRAVSGKPA